MLESIFDDLDAAKTNSSKTNNASSSTNLASNTPSVSPINLPKANPSRSPTDKPSKITTNNPSTKPLKVPTNAPSVEPIEVPILKSSEFPSLQPLFKLTSEPSMLPTLAPSANQSFEPSLVQSLIPKLASDLTFNPTFEPSVTPTTTKQTLLPSLQPSFDPSLEPSTMLSNSPSSDPTLIPQSSSTSSSTRPGYAFNTTNLVPVLVKFNMTQVYSIPIETSLHTYIQPTLYAIERILNSNRLITNPVTIRLTTVNEQAVEELVEILQKQNTHSHHNTSYAKLKSYSLFVNFQLNIQVRSIIWVSKPSSTEAHQSEVEIVVKSLISTFKNATTSTTSSLEYKSLIQFIQEFCFQDLACSTYEAENYVLGRIYIFEPMLQVSDKLEPGIATATQISLHPAVSPIYSINRNISQSSEHQLTVSGISNTMMIGIAIGSVAILVILNILLFRYIRRQYDLRDKESEDNNDDESKHSMSELSSEPSAESNRDVDDQVNQDNNNCNHSENESKPSALALTCLAVVSRDLPSCSNIQNVSPGQQGLFSPIPAHRRLKTPPSSPPSSYTSFSDTSNNNTNNSFDRKTTKLNLNLSTTLDQFSLDLDIDDTARVTTGRIDQTTDNHSINNNNNNSNEEESDNDSDSDIDEDDFDLLQQLHHMSHTNLNSLSE